MLPQGLAGSYRQYKKDTLVVTTWLAKTVVSTCGYDMKKIASSYGKTQQNDLRSSAKKKYIVTVKELLKQAGMVMASSQAVPRAVIRALDRATAARRKFTTWFKLHMAEEEESNDNHQAFVEVLEEIAYMLRPLEAPKKLKKRHKSKSSDEEYQNMSHGVHNRFQGLHIHDETDIDEDEDEEDALLEADLSSETDKLSDVEFDLEMPTDSKNHFKLLCLIQDMVKFRAHMRGVWTRYKNREIGLITAGTITTAAINLFEDMESTAAEDCNLMSCCPGEHFLPFLAVVAELAKTKPEMVVELINVEDLIAFSTVHRTIIGLQTKGPRTVGCPPGCGCPEYLHLAPIVHEDMAPILELADNLATLDSCSSTSIEHIHNTIKKENILLGQQMLDFRIVEDVESRAKVQGKLKPIADPILQGLRLALENTTTLWTILVCRILLDIQECLGDDIDAIYNDLITSTASKQKHLDFVPCENKGCPCIKGCGDGGFFWIENAPHFDMDNISRLWYTVKESGLGDRCIFTKLVAARIWSETDAELGHLDKLVSYHADQAHYLKQNVLRTAMIQLTIALDMEYAGISLENQFWPIYSLAHMYNLGRQLGYLPVPWPEMDQVIELQQDALFGSGLPTDATAAHNCFLRKARVSAQFFAKNVREKKTRRMKLDPVHFTKDPIFMTCRKHFLEGKLSAEQLLYSLVPEKQESSIFRDYTIEYLLQESEKTLTKVFDQTKHFDYLSFTRKCAEVMIDICNELDFLDRDLSLAIRLDDNPCKKRNTYTLMTGEMLNGVARDLSGGATGTTFEHNCKDSSCCPHLYTIKKFEIVLKTIEMAYAEEFE